MSSEQTSTGSNKKFYSVFNGAFRTKVPEGTPESFDRINKKGVRVFELEAQALRGIIEDVAIEDSDYGKQIKITLDENDKGQHPILSFGVESKDGRDVLKKLPAIDFSKEVLVRPYRFIPEDKDEEISGISITQPDEEGMFKNKVENFFFDPETKKYIHNYPMIDWDKATEPEQKIYKIQRDAFLLDYVQNNVIPSFSEKPADSGFEYPENDISPEDVAF